MQEQSFSPAVHCVAVSARIGRLVRRGSARRFRFLSYLKFFSVCRSRELDGETIDAGMLRLQEQGAETLDLVTGSHYAPWIAESLRQVKPQLHIPVVWNSSGYDSPEILSLLNGLVDVYLPDWKYVDNATAEQYSGIPDYCTVTEQAISEMVRQVGTPVLNHGILQRGVLIRHLILPGQRHASMALLRKIAATFPDGQVWVSLMGQYTPPETPLPDRHLNRRLTTMEYQSVLKVAQELELEGFSQDLTSARKTYIPSFSLEGLDEPSQKT